MKAALCAAYGPPEVLQIGEIEKPAPKHNEVLIRICATAVTASDCIVRGFKLSRWSPMGLSMGLMLGFTRPRNPIIGTILAGEVEATGKDVARFRTGDQVYASTMLRFGAYAEYICLPETVVIAPKPRNLTFEEAAAIPYGGRIALHFLPGWSGRLPTCFTTTAAGSERKPWLAHRSCLPACRYAAIIQQAWGAKTT